MKKPKFSLITKDEEMETLVAQSGHKVLAIWARDCVKRVLPFFTDQFPDDPRPEKALDTLQAWIDTSEFSMEVIRYASLNAHAAARAVSEDSPSRSAARAAGQAVATAHVRTHALGAAKYAQQAVHYAASPEDALEKVAQERNWQYKYLVEINSIHSE
jgi:hypothetical protein